MQRLHPARDDARDGEADGLAAIHRAVEDRAVNQRAVVVHLDLVRGLRHRAGPRLEDLVLEAGSRGLHAFLLRVGREERLAILHVLLAVHLGLRLHLGHGHLAQVVQRGADVLLRHRGLALEGVRDRRGEDLWVKVQVLPLEVGADVRAQGVADASLRILEVGLVLGDGGPGDQHRGGHGGDA